VQKMEVGAEPPPPPPPHVTVEFEGTPSDGLLTKLAKLVGADAWLRAGVAADL